MDHKTKQELNQLSKIAFGTSSKWKKLMDGVAEPMERHRKAMVMVGGKPTEKTFVDRKSVMKYYSLDEVKQLMAQTIAERMASSAKEPKEEKRTPEVGVTVDTLDKNTFIMSKESYTKLEGSLKD